MENKTIYKTPKFKVGDKVDYVNDFGVCFKDNIITKVNNDKTYLTTLDTRFPVPEENLYVAGSWDRNSLDKELKNGIIAKFEKNNDWGEKIYKITLDSGTIRVVEVDESFYTMSIDGDPISLIPELEPK